ncbi:MAG TPA: type II toxin-antitoxin system HicA family toxin [Candidatus Acidoferrales bacterium]|nr:type II toxin-antitoxin system HicA family toxin [Candidatus Acidoferrales bacterium]
MSVWPSTKASKVLRALLRIGFTIKSQRGSHIVLSHPSLGEYVWAFHESVEIGPKMLSRIAKHTGLKPEDL